MTVTFTAHNILLDDGRQTRPEAGMLTAEHAWCRSAKRILDVMFINDRAHRRVVDLGCLEGGYAIEFARMGFDTVGIEVRRENIAACQYAKSQLSLPNLKFVHDDAWNIANYGEFDAAFCGGLLYHLDEPQRFLRILGRCTTKLLIVNTHFATSSPFFLRRRSRLSRLKWHEGMKGRWYAEFSQDLSSEGRETLRWAAWRNHRSFWLCREWLIQAVRDSGFDVVLEQFDSLGTNIVESMTQGYYKTDSRGMFVGIKSNIG